jgi:glycosyltransferase involved in cell wall biosynthesis
MKIAVDARVLLDKHYSGVANFSFHLLKNILKIDNKNDYCFFYNSFEKREITDFQVKKVESRYPNKIFNYFLQKTLKYPKLDKVVGGCDLFYLPHINFACFSGKARKIITIHDLSFLRYPEFFSSRKNFWHKAINIKKEINNFDRIIAVSENTKNDIVELLKVPEDKVSVVYSGIDLSFSEIENKKDYKFDKDYILYLGNIEPRKNISGIISAYNQLREKGHDIDLVLAGAWGWKVAEIKKSWQESKYRDDIKFIGYVSDDHKYFLYKKAKLFIYPSFYEGFGFPPLEAMSLDVPVIASNSSSLPEILGDASFLINPSKKEEIYESLDLILKDKALRDHFVEKGRERVKRFSWEKTAQEYLKIFYEK